MPTQKAQELFWEIETLTSFGAEKLVRPKRRELARIRELRARDLFERADPDGFIDLYAAVTQWGLAGDTQKARGLLDEGHVQALRFDAGRDAIDAELSNLSEWLKQLRVLPALSNFDQALPPKSTGSKIAA